MIDSTKSLRINSPVINDDATLPLALMRSCIFGGKRRARPFRVTSLAALSQLPSVTARRPSRLLLLVADEAASGTEVRSGWYHGVDGVTPSSKNQRPGSSE